MNQQRMILLAVVIALSVISWGYFLDQTGLSSRIIPELSNPTSLVQGVTNYSFFYALILVALMMVLLYVTSLLLNEQEAMITSFVGTSFGLLLSMMIFTNGIFYSLAGIALVSGSVIFVKVANTQRKELHWLVNARSAGAAVGKMNLLIAVGLLVSVAAAAYNPPTRAQLNENFEDFIISQAFSTSNSLSNASADFAIKTQQQNLKAIQNLPSYQALTDNNNPEDVEFVNNINQISDQLESPEFRKKLEQQLNQNGASSQLSFSQLVKQVPMIQTIEDNWWWVVALSVMLLFLFFSNIVIKPITMVLAEIAGFLVVWFNEQKEKSTP